MALDYLNRYTDLSNTIHVLETRTLTLRDPERWDDKNDSHFMTEYKQKKDAKTVLALCFAQAPETYHHWHVSSHSFGGVCIQFDKRKLTDKFGDDPRTKQGTMNYKTLRELRKRKVTTDQLPFLKRSAYADEREFRVLYVNQTRKVLEKTFDIRLSWIREVRLSPWMPKEFIPSVRHVLRLIDGCTNLKIVRSPLIESEMWKKETAKIVS